MGIYLFVEGDSVGTESLIIHICHHTTIAQRHQCRHTTTTLINRRFNPLPSGEYHLYYKPEFCWKLGSQFLESTTQTQSDRIGVHFLGRSVILGTESFNTSVRGASDTFDVSPQADVRRA